ncbi:transposase [Facklamia sp. P12932]|uniref:transposase n=1 Tax=Facklamia sp. P12932 TaxID=3421947 RepID=UPI003D176AA7
MEISYAYIPEEAHVVHFIDGLVNQLAIDHPYVFGRPREYPLSAVLKLILFAYTREIFTSRKIERFAAENLPAQWLTQGRVPSHTTICRCRVDESIQAILDAGFDGLVNYLMEQHLIDDALFIDGTKILANANKYTFVWKKNIIRFDEVNEAQIKELLKETKVAYQDMTLPEGTDLTMDQLEEVMTQLESCLEALEKEVEETKKQSPNPAKQSRRRLKSLKHPLNERIEKKQNYEKHRHLLGDRHSYSKTDTDATFMRMKEDPMRNGQTKPGYNLQNATSHQYVLAYDIYPNPTDTRTLQPFFETHRALIDSMTYVSMDAGYGSESNYAYLEDHHPDTIAIIPYSTMLKEQTKKWQSDEKKVFNWTYHEADDYYIDLQGVRFNFSAYRERKNHYDEIQQFKEYKAETHTSGGERIEAAFTPKGSIRKISVNPS